MGVGVASQKIVVISVVMGWEVVGGSGEVGGVVQGRVEVAAVGMSRLDL